MIDDFLVSIVLYKQRLEDSLSYITLSKSLSGISRCTFFVYDNSPESQVIPRSGDFEFIYVHNPGNAGISKAYNEAALVAGRLQKRWLLFMDQDTHFSEDFLQVLFRRIAGNSDIHIFSPILRSGSIVVSPCWTYWEKGFPMKRPQPGRQNLKYKSIINSGLCVSLAAFKIAGGYDDKIRLDFSDHYFVKKLKKNFKQFFVIEAPVEHSLSTFADDYVSKVRRFKFYCDGARHYSTYKTVIPLFVICTFRMLKLSILNKSLKFVRIYFEYYVFSKPLSLSNV